MWGNSFNNRNLLLPWTFWAKDPINNKFKQWPKSPVGFLVEVVVSPAEEVGRVYDGGDDPTDYASHDGPPCRVDVVVSRVVAQEDIPRYARKQPV